MVCVASHLEPAMKKIAIFLACSIALTLVFYEIADYLVPGSPSEEMTFLLAVIAVVLVWVVQSCIRVSRVKKDGAPAVR
jgi:hypothetical protein